MEPLKAVTIAGLFGAAVFNAILAQKLEPPNHILLAFLACLSTAMGVLFLLT